MTILSSSPSPRNPRPSATKVIPENLPPELKRVPQWILWRYEWRDKKWKKPPVDPRTGAEASVTDRRTWTSFDQASAAHARGLWRADGMGFVFCPEDPYLGIDLDDCVGSDGAIAAAALEMIIRLETYSEFSPSRGGVHAIAIGKIPRGLKRPEIEMYDRARYFTMTGDLISFVSARIEDRRAIVTAIYTEITAKITAEKSSQPVIEIERAALPHIDRNLITMAMSARNGAKFRRLWAGDWSGYRSPSEADLALASVLMFWTRGDRERAKRLMRRSALWRPKYEREGYLDRMLDRAYWRGRRKAT
jgi:primase-polymerase (primpol)-like protein